MKNRARRFIMQQSQQVRFAASTALKQAVAAADDGLDDIFNRPSQDLGNFKHFFLHLHA